MSMIRETPERTARLAKFFREALRGNRDVQSGADAKLFLEATRAQPCPSTCIESIVASKKGGDALRVALRADLSLDFVRDWTLPFVKYLSDEKVKVLAEGQLLRQVLAAIAVPPTLWNTIVDMALEGGMDENELAVFAWLCAELLCLPDDALDGQDLSSDIKRIVEGGVFARASSMDVRQCAYRIGHLLQLRRTSPGTVHGSYAPGGRHVCYYPFLSICVPFPHSLLLSSSIARTSEP